MCMWTRFAGIDLCNLVNKSNTYVDVTVALCFLFPLQPKIKRHVLGISLGGMEVIAEHSAVWE